jgi:hypothetical protein
MSSRMTNGICGARGITTFSMSVGICGARGGITILSVLLLAMGAAQAANAARIRDIGQFRGMRENQLVGYGLIMGLDGTGDR